MLGQRLQRARLAAGFSLRELAERTGVSHTAVSKWEKGQNMPSSSQLIALARHLGVRTEFFFRPQQVRLEGVEYRKRATTSKGLLRRVEVDVLDQAERWRELLDLFPQSPIHPFGLPDSLPERFDNLVQVEQSAETLRDHWHLGLNPVPDLIDTLEAQGMMVIVTRVDSGGKLDGMAGRIAAAPFVVVSREQPGDRQRFTLAHELGHLLLEGRIEQGLLDAVGGRTPEAALEKLCNHFAGAFLLPRQAIRERLGEHRQNLELQELHLLKHEFGLSMQACLFRAWQADIISAALRERMFKLFSIRGWRSSEPGQACPPETTVLFEQLVYRALAENYIGESKAAELLLMPLARFHRQRKLESPHAAADQ